MFFNRNMAALDPSHFLAPRPITSTLAAHDFDVDNRTGFMPPRPPLRRLPPQWELWESLLDRAKSEQIQLGNKPDLTDEAKATSEKWRRDVRAMPILPTLAGETRDEELLRRAHLVLAWMLHFYVHSIPAEEGDGNPKVIPRALTVPLLRVCAHLQIPPVLTYSDTVLYNWDMPASDEHHHHSTATPAPTPTPTTPLQSLTLFTSTLTEQEFYLVSARIELCGVRALDLMRATMDEMFVDDDIAMRRITGFLEKLKGVVEGMIAELKGLRGRGCDPDVFYKEVRPWIRGADSDAWVFEGFEEEGEEEPMWPPVELSGPSAGQSSLIHALDVFLGVDKYSHAVGAQPHAESFLTRMQQYMPRRHRSFLQHLAANPRPLRELVARSTSGELVEAYNGAVRALKEFRDGHMVIVGLYIIGPARRAQSEERTRLKGTGGTDMVHFLKAVRDQTMSALL
jgi:indoleamine 2,3-dioxygenase